MAPRSPHVAVQLVLFDLGGVVCRFSHERRLAALARVSGLSTQQVHQRLFASGFDLECDRGRYTLVEQCDGIRARLGVRISDSELEALWAEAFAPDAELLAIVRGVRPSARTAMLTNNGPLVDVMVREHFCEVASTFDELCFSYQAKSVKPEPMAYLNTLQRLQVAPRHCVFVDDAEQNVLGARAVGINAIRFESPELVIEALRQYGFP